MLQRSTLAPPNFIRQAAIAGKWIALVTGTLLFLFVMIFVVGEVTSFFFAEDLPQGPPLPVRDRVAIAGGLTLLTGLVAAWRWELLGGAGTLVGFLMMWAAGGFAPLYFPFWVPPVVGTLHMLCGWWLGPRKMRS